jgi:hypothetical protein
MGANNTTMIFWLTVCFYLFTACLAFLAILNQTWAKDKPVLANRIRWGSLILIVLVFVTSVVKENFVDVRDQKARQESKTAQDELLKTIQVQSREIGSLSQQLRDADATISDTRTKLLEAQLASQKTSEAIQAYVYERLSSSTYSYVVDLGRMIAQASNGWLPGNKEELFSKRSVELICRWLNAEGNAPVYPARPWYAWYNDISKRYEDVLVNSLNAYASRLPPSLIQSVSGVARSDLIGLPKTLVQIHQITKEQGFKHSPMICMAVFDNQMEKAFAQLFQLVSQLGQAEKKFKLQSRMDDRLLLSGVRSVTVGTNRLKQSEIDAYLKSQERPAVK